MLPVRFDNTGIYDTISGKINYFGWNSAYSEPRSVNTMGGVVPGQQWLLVPVAIRLPVTAPVRRLLLRE